MVFIVYFIYALCLLPVIIVNYLPVRKLAIFTPKDIRIRVFGCKCLVCMVESYNRLSACCCLAFIIGRKIAFVRVLV
jgi:hypothetical protein